MKWLEWINPVSREYQGCSRSVAFGQGCLVGVHLTVLMESAVLGRQLLNNGIILRVLWNRHLACSRSSGIGIFPVQDLVE